MVAASETRAAAFAPDSPAAEMATGNPSEAPRPHRIAPELAMAWSSAKTTRARPPTLTRALTHRTATGPNLSTKRPPMNRPTVIAVAKTAKTPDPRAASRPWPSTMTSGNQSFAAPSAMASARMTPPMSSSRVSFQTAVRGRSAAVRAAARLPTPAGMGRIAAPRAATTIAATIHRWATTGKDTAVRAMPTIAPTTVPRLKKPCIRGIADRPSRRSTSAPSMLRATSPPPHAAAEESQAEGDHGAGAEVCAGPDDRRSERDHEDAGDQDRAGAQAGDERP